jgi:hypothetical protein
VLEIGEKMIETDENFDANNKLTVLITYNRNSENVFQNHFGKHFPKQFWIMRSKIFEFLENVFRKMLTFRKMELEKYWNMNEKNKYKNYR